mgnify:CR=1 FL=1
MSRRLASILIPVLVAGCAGESAPVPETENAKAALRQALETWKAGKPASLLASSTPKIDVVDFDWRGNAVLTDFQIGGEESGQGTRTLAASITLKGKPSRNVKYMVLGSDPIQIYREEDFLRAMNMENNPTTKTRSR